jgi:hypothetical protein
MSQNQNRVLGRVNLGWTVGEELLFASEQQTQACRQESCFAETESCLLGINKSKLAIL